MNLTRLLTLAVAVGTLLCSSCQSSKIAYGNSYYFKATPRPTDPVPDLYASTAPATIPSRSLTPDDFVAVVPSSPAPVPQAEEQTMTRKEVRQAQKVHRKAMRTHLKQRLREAPASVKEQVKQQVDGFTRVGIIVGAAGLVMLLVGLLAGGNGFLVGLGGILLGVGLVFYLIDVL